MITDPDNQTKKNIADITGFIDDWRAQIERKLVGREIVHTGGPAYGKISVISSVCLAQSATGSRVFLTAHPHDEFALHELGRNCELLAENDTPKTEETDQ